MQFIFDNLVATFVGTVVILVLLGLSTTWTEEGIDQTQTHMTREMQRTLVEMFERDVINIGANVPVGQPMIAELTDSTFAFYGAVNGTGAAKHIRYRVKPVVQPDESVVYGVERWVDGEYSGGSPALLEWFEVKLQTANGAPVTTPPYTQARKIVLRFKSRPPFKNMTRSNGAGLQHLHWESVYRPTLLDR